MKITTNFKKKVTPILHALFLFIILFPISCSPDKQKNATIKPSLKVTSSINYDLDSIKKSGVLKAITTFSPTGYFLYP